MNKKKLINYFIIVIVILSLLFISLIIVLRITWKPTIKAKTSFSASDISVIASELSIPEQGLELSEMHFSHAKDSVFILKGSSNSNSFMDSFKYCGKKGNDEYYNLKNNNNSECYIQKNDSVYCFKIIIYDYNQTLLNIM